MHIMKLIVRREQEETGDKFMYQHAMKAPDEMRELHKQFYAYVKRMKACGCKVKNAGVIGG